MPDRTARRRAARSAGTAVLAAAVALIAAACGRSSATPATSRPAAASTIPTTTATPTTPPVTVAPTTAPPATVPPTTTAPPPPPAPPPPSGIPIGPGPQATYAVQAQPAPGSCHYRYDAGLPLPDPACTPGALSPAVTQDNLASTICMPGYTSSVRPPSSITGAEKVGSAAAYGYTGSFRTGEYDHLVSLELGGDPNDPRNLWVEPNDRAGAASTYNGKDPLENHLHDLVCAGQLSLAAAQQAIATDWAAALQRYGT